MKFTFTLLTVFAASCFAFGQNVPIDFETGGNGESWTWTVFENDLNPALEIVDNPDQSGANMSCTVAKFTALQTGNPWAGCETMHGADIGTWTIDQSNSTIKILVWKDVISDVGIKLVRDDGWSLGEIKIPNTVTNQWEEITFDFSSHMGNTYDQIVIFPDFDLAGRTSDRVIYFDHIYGDATSLDTCVCMPTTHPVPDVPTLSDVQTDSCSLDTLATPTATDSCGAMIMGVSDATLPITTVGTTVVTWTFTDIAGNEASQTQNVIIDCVTSIEELSEASFSVYPVPSQNQITVETPAGFTGQLMITNVLGRHHMTTAINITQTSLNLTNLPAKGTYFGRILDKDGNLVATKKIIYQ